MGKGTGKEQEGKPDAVKATQSSTTQSTAPASNASQFVPSDAAIANISSPLKHISTAAETRSSPVLTAADRPSIKSQTRWRSGSDKGSMRRFKYSTEDEGHEVEQDLEREYLEGYQDGLKKRLRKQSKMARSPLMLPSQLSQTSEIDENALTRKVSGASDQDQTHTQTQSQSQSQSTQTQQQRHGSSLGSAFTGSSPLVHAQSAANVARQQQHLQHDTVKNYGNLHAHFDKHVPGQDDDLDNPDPLRLSRDSSHNGVPDAEENDEADHTENKRKISTGNSDYDDTDDNRNENESNDGGVDEEDGDDSNKAGNDDDDDDDDDGASLLSNETFTLRERQDAINTTHPFGIRIWKPAVYKKIRSVQRIAEGEIHSQPGKQVSWSIWAGNGLWTILFGTVLFLACLVASAFCLLAFWSESSQRYGRVMFSLGVYLFFPFGRYVELAHDENYLSEDEGQGRSIADYQRWQAGDIEHGRLFFETTLTTQHADDASPAGSTSTESMRETEASPRSVRHDTDDTRANANYNDSDSEGDPLLGSKSPRRRLFGRGEWNIGRVLFYFWFYILILPLLILTSVICWLGVFSVPMAKVSASLVFHLRRHPLALSFKPARRRPVRGAGDASPIGAEEEARIVLCTYRAWGLKYYKYTIDGTNIIIINLMAPVLFVIFDYYVLHEYYNIGGILGSNAFLFCMSLMAIIPLAYFIGQAVASLSAQTSMGMGAVINAFFSTIVEVFLYSVALQQGKGALVEGSIIGSIFAGVLLLPGLSMCAGAIKRKTQRYNPRSAGVTSTMLVFAVIGAFSPTIFYQIFGPYELQCAEPRFPASESRQCHFIQAPLVPDNFYYNIIQPFSILCAVMLFISYVIGLWFTLRTHAAMIWANAGQEHGPLVQVTSAGPNSGSGAQLNNTAITISPRKPSLPGLIGAADQVGAVAEVAAATGGHDAPNWSRTKSSVILLGATLLYAIIAEILVGTVDVVLKHVSISQKFLGITMFALVPNTTEFLNAISFAMNGNIALSMEIGTAYALQVCLLQIPTLVIFSILAHNPRKYIGPISEKMFTLIFPKWDLTMVLFCVFLFSYVYAEGKSNYFKGSILILTYIVTISGFYFADLPYLSPSFGGLSTASGGLFKDTTEL